MLIVKYIRVLLISLVSILWVSNNDLFANWGMKGIYGISTFRIRDSFLNYRMYEGTQTGFLFSANIRPRKRRVFLRYEIGVVNRNYVTNNFSNQKTKLSLTYFEQPLSLVWRLPFKYESVDFIVGGLFNFIVAGKYTEGDKVRKVKGAREPVYPDDDKYYVNPLYGAWNFGLGYNTSRLMLGINYQVGFNNIYKHFVDKETEKIRSSKGNVRLSGFNLMLGYWFK